METLIDILVSSQFAIMGVLVGWTMPRGKHLKAIQLRVLRALMRWLHVGAGIYQSHWCRASSPRR